MLLNVSLVTEQNNVLIHVQTGVRGWMLEKKNILWANCYPGLCSSTAKLRPAGSTQKWWQKQRSRKNGHVYHRRPNFSRTPANVISYKHLLLLLFYLFVIVMLYSYPIIQGLPPFLNAIQANFKWFLENHDSILTPLCWQLCETFWGCVVSWVL